MRNYFKALHLRSNASRAELSKALTIGSDTAGKIMSQHQVDAYDVLLDADKRDVYANTVELYEAMHIASRLLHQDGGTDTHSWKERLADFDTAVADYATDL